MFYGSADKSIKAILNEMTAQKHYFESSSEHSSEGPETAEAQYEEELVQHPTYRTVGVPREIHPEEKRVAVTPPMLKHFNKSGFSLKIESGAGAAAHFADHDYESKGAAIVSTAEAWDSDIVLKVRKPEDSELIHLHRTQLLVSYISPAANGE